MEHVGSTAVPGLYAKPVIDVMVGLGSPSDAERCVAPLEVIGYEHRPDLVLPDRLLFLVKHDPGGFRTHHLHATTRETPFWETHLLFRDYLREHPETAREYARLKRDVAARLRDDREAYTDAKTTFISAVLGRARA